MKNTDEVAIFWDYENCPAPTNTSGYTIVNNIRSVAQTFGSVTLFKAYLEITEQVPVSRGLLLRSELQSSGVSLTDCPHNGRKDVADKMILVDMLAHAIDKPAPSTIVLISGDRDFAYALSILRLRRYHVVLITLSNAHPSLRAQASRCFDWVSDVLEPVDLTFSHQTTTCPRRAKTSAPPTHDKFYPDSKGHNPLRSPFQESYDDKTPSCGNFISYFQDKVRRREHSQTPPKHDFLPLPDMEQSERPSVAAPSTLINGPESPASVIHHPVPSSCHPSLNGTIETPLTMTPHDSNSSQTTSTPNSSAGSTPKPEPYGSIMASKSSGYISLRHSASLPNLAQHIASLTQPVPLESAMRISPVEPDLRESFPSSQQQGAYSSETQSLSNVDHMNDHDGDPDSPPAHSEIPPPPNVTTPPSVSTPSIMHHPNPSHPTVSAVAQIPVQAADPLPSTPVPAIPVIFKTLVQCLKSHRSKGHLRPLRSHVALEIANGGTYRQAGVSRFRDYVAIAEKAGLIEVGGWHATAWIALKEPWCDTPLS